MKFRVEQRRAWIRTRSHTVVFDRDPDFGRFCADPTGVVKRMLRVWLVDSCDEEPLPRAYLGAVGLSGSGSGRASLLRLFRRAGNCAPLARSSRRAMRRGLAETLRKIPLGENL